MTSTLDWLRTKRDEAWDRHLTAAEAYKHLVSDPDHDRIRALELAREFDQTKTEALIIDRLCDAWHHEHREVSA